MNSQSSSLKKAGNDVAGQLVGLAVTILFLMSWALFVYKARDWGVSAWTRYTDADWRVASIGFSIAFGFIGIPWCLAAISHPVRMKNLHGSLNSRDLITQFPTSMVHASRGFRSVIWLKLPIITALIAPTLHWKPIDAANHIKLIARNRIGEFFGAAMVALIVVMSFVISFSWLEWQVVLIALITLLASRLLCEFIIDQSLKLESAN